MKTSELLKENIYKVTYKNGNQRDYKFYSMVEHGDNYLTLRQPWCGNPVPGVISGEHIEKVECIEKNIQKCSGQTNRISGGAIE